MDNRYVNFRVFIDMQEGVGDTNDAWQVEIVGGEDGDLVRTVISRIKLRHVNIGCYLHSHSTQLPKW